MKDIKIVENTELHHINYRAKYINYKNFLSKIVIKR